MKCYLCGSTEKLSRDHIPPKGFFPPPLPSNLITVTCCEPCNNAFSKDDEAARMWFSCVLGASPAAQWIFENKVLTKSVKRAPGVRDAILDSMRDVTLKTEDGLIEACAFTVPHERVNSFLVRITKGLLTHYFPEHDYTTAVFEVRHIIQSPENLENLEPIRDLLGYDFRGQGVFQYRGRLTESRQSGVWILVFYEAMLFVVTHTKNNWGKPIIGENFASPRT